MKKLLIIVFILITTNIYCQEYNKKNVDVFHFEYPKEWTLQVPGGFGEVFQLSISDDKGYGHITGIKEKKTNTFLIEVNNARESQLSSDNKELSFTKINDSTYKLSLETINLFDQSKIYVDHYLYDYKDYILTIIVFYNDKSKKYFIKDASHFIDTLKFM